MRANLFLVSGVALACPVFANADVFSNVPEAAGYTLAYNIPIGGTTTSNAAIIPYGSFSRVGYYLELQANTPNAPLQYAYASFDAQGFSGNAFNIGVPSSSTGAFFQQRVTNLNVVSNVGGIVTGSGLSTGNIQFWPANYGQTNSANVPNANGGTFDFGDAPDYHTNPGYGALQISNYGASQTVLAYNQFGAGGNADVGIGNNPAAGTGNQQPNWTFASNGGNYSVKDLQIVVGGGAQPNAPAAPSALVAKDPTLAGYKVVYHQAIPTGANYNGNLAYTQDFSGSPNVAPGSFQHVAYFMDLQDASGADHWVSASFDASSLSTDPTKLGIPTLQSRELYQNGVTNLHVASNVAGVTTGNGLTGGAVQFWPSNYGTNGGNVFGPGNTSFNNTDQGYGLMEIDDGSNVVMAYNNWDGNGGDSGVGIGNDPSQGVTNPASGQPEGQDYTFANNAGNYTVKDLYILVDSVPEPGSLVIAGGSFAAMLLGRRRFFL